MYCAKIMFNMSYISPTKLLPGLKQKYLSYATYNHLLFYCR